jgi:hypothetical protein
MSEPQAEPGDQSILLGRAAPSNGVRLVLEETERVRARIEQTLGGDIDPLYILLGMIPNATRRIITELPPGSAQDSANVFLASRLLTASSVRTS